MAETQPPPRRFPVEPTWRTMRTERTVLVVVRTVTALSRLLDIVPLLRADRRIQLLCTYDAERPAKLGAGVAEALARWDIPVLDWADATAGDFDLAIAASENDALHELAAPVLLFPHGFGFQKHYPGTGVIAGMDRNRLLHNGSPVPAALAVAQQEQLDLLAAACPELVSNAVVAGDPCHDRLVASQHRVPAYRDTLGLGERTLVVLASTWGPESLFGSEPELPERLLATLPADEYQVALLLHPGVWAAHGRHQVHGWLSAARDAGLLLVNPLCWQPVLASAGLVITDAGSTGLYAAALDVPLLLTGGTGSTVPGSAIAELTSRCARLDVSGDLLDQIVTARHTHLPGSYRPVLKQALDAPGESAKRLRSLLYRLLELDEPSWPAEYPPIPTTPADRTVPGAHIVGGQISDQTVTLQRFPLVRGQRSPEPLHHRHIVADPDHAWLRTLSSAGVVVTNRAVPDFADWARKTLRQWPDAHVVATVADGACRVSIRDGRSMVLRAPDIDPALLASLAYLDGLGRFDAVSIAGRRVPVSVTELVTG